jgi:hypothetical protein
VFPELAASGHIVEGRGGVQQQRQLGAIDPGLGRGVLADRLLTQGDLLGREGRLVRGHKARHDPPPVRPTLPHRASPYKQF